MSADAFVSCARDQLGKPYVWGTHGPNTFDCSGLVCYCYEQATGKKMTCSSVEQFKLGAKIPSGEVVQPGDLYFWDTDGTGAGHVAIYEADGQVIHALNPQRDVIRSSTYAPMGGPMTGVRRIFPQENVEGETKPPKPKRRPRKRRRR